MSVSSKNRRSNGHLNVSNLSITVINNVDQVEALLEQFFIFHTNFLWDRAKELIEHERDAFRATHHSHVSSILASLMNALSQLTLADKSYLTLQFFSSTLFQRKDSVKCSYENLRSEFQRLEERGYTIGQQKSVSQPQTPHHQAHNSPSNCYSQQTSQPPNEQALDVLDVEELFGEETANRQSRSASPAIADIDAPVYTPTPPKSQSFISRFFSFKSNKHLSSSTSPNTTLSANDSINSICINGDESSPKDSTLGLAKAELSCSLESLDRFAAHLSGQLVYYIKARIEMIDLYDKLSCVCPGRKFCLMDECFRTLSGIHKDADQNFHHPVLNRLKSMFMFEADILLSLVRVHTNIQNWKFLDSLFFLQDAHNKLNMMANMRDQMLSSLNTYTSNSLMKSQGTNPISPLVPSASSSALRRNVTSSSLSSSGSSTLSVPGPGPNGSNGGAGVVGTNSITSGTSNHSPLMALNFTYSSQYIASMYAQPKLFASKFNTSTMPMLIQWLNRYKLFLLSKYSFYFHSLLMVHLTPSSIASSSFSASIGSSSNHSSSANYAHIESQMRQLCSKHLYDFHSRIVQFVRKCDSSYMILIFDTHDKEEFSVSGYRSPYLKKELPKGINSYPVIYSYPGEFPKNRIPSLIMIMNDRIKQLNTEDSVVVEHDKPNADGHSAQNGSSSVTSAMSTAGLLTNSQQPYGHTNSATSSLQMPNATYFLIRPDPDFTLAMICEQKKSERDTHIVAFMLELTTMLKGTKIFASLRNGSLK